MPQNRYPETLDRCPLKSDRELTYGGSGEGGSGGCIVPVNEHMTNGDCFMVLFRAFCAGDADCASEIVCGKVRGTAFGDDGLKEPGNMRGFTGRCELILWGIITINDLTKGLIIGRHKKSKKNFRENVRKNPKFIDKDDCLRYNETVR